MILVRDVFRLQFGKARDALGAFKQVGDYAAKAGFDPKAMRVLTDLVGPYYTLVLETTAADLAAWEQQGRTAMSDPEWRKLYEKFIPYVESGYREVFTIVQ
jgi:hypothetical protein